ncbi:hypothetical protein GCM10017772_29890 [Promicromonospora soli]|uniref:Uncharacterized protein n=1 Tax=Promicromonospora soli TaxID=2035533 RepID=A0A919KVK4_9MICO|nr:hypothetical protein GCM10017772_29890 [Promicromonospora soli]
MVTTPSLATPAIQSRSLLGRVDIQIPSCLGCGGGGKLSFVGIAALGDLCLEQPDRAAVVALSGEWCEREGFLVLGELDGENAPVDRAAIRTDGFSALPSSARTCADL